MHMQEKLEQRFKSSNDNKIAITLEEYEILLSELDLEAQQKYHKKYLELAEQNNLIYKDTVEQLEEYYGKEMDFYSPLNRVQRYSIFCSGLVVGVLPFMISVL